MTKSSDPIDAKLDGWLADWPAPERDDESWESFGGRLQDRLAELSIGQGEEAWLLSPLPVEPGEPGEQASIASGGARMSDADADQPSPKKKSLKDFAQRVSVAPPVADATQSPVPKATDSPLPTSGPRASSPSLRASSPSLRASSASFVSRPEEARDSDSGIVDLNAVRKSAESTPDTGAQPAEAGLFDDDQKVAVAAPAKKSSLLPIAGGGLVAALALAAAVFVVVRGQSANEPASIAMPAAPLATATSEVANSPVPAASGLSAESLGLASDSEKAAQPAAAGAPPSDDEAKARASKASQDGAENDESKKDKGDKDAPADPNDLAGAMATAVGDTDKKSEQKDKPAGPAVDPGAIPEIPSQGAIQGAIGSVKGAAKGCVAGLDDASRASITFRSDGSVSSVSVSGAAAGKPAAACIQSALKGARVGPFKRSSFTVGVTLRP